MSFVESTLNQREKKWIIVLYIRTSKQPINKEKIPKQHTKKISKAAQGTMLFEAQLLYAVFMQGIHSFMAGI